MTPKPTDKGTPKVDIKEALKKKKKTESNKTLLIWGLIGVGVFINAFIVYTKYITIHYHI